uniref:SLBP_RNA_bind domain-containing protein n=1 Tax=Panagrellus redivivus TaxID=6233 RepID=A0A7E4UUA0_PANRE
MGQAVKKMRRSEHQEPSSDGEYVDSAQEVTDNGANAGVAGDNNAKDKSVHSNSTGWMTELPTRSSSVFSEPTGYSTSGLSTGASGYTSGTILTNSLKSSAAVARPVAETKPPVERLPERETTQGTSEHTQDSRTSSSNTSRDHPALGKVEVTREEWIRRAHTDNEWQTAVNQFLHRDPIAKTPKQRKRARYVIQRHYRYIATDIGVRWKAAIRTWAARQPPITTLLPESEWSEA